MQDWRQVFCVLLFVCVYCYADSVSVDDTGNRQASRGSYNLMLEPEIGKEYFIETRSRTLTSEDKGREGHGKSQYKIIAKVEKEDKLLFEITFLHRCTTQTVNGKTIHLSSKNPEDIMQMYSHGDFAVSALNYPILVQMNRYGAITAITPDPNFKKLTDAYMEIMKPRIQRGMKFDEEETAKMLVEYIYKDFEKVFVVLPHNPEGKTFSFSGDSYTTKVQTPGADTIETWSFEVAENDELEFSLKGSYKPTEKSKDRFIDGHLTGSIALDLKTKFPKSGQINYLSSRISRVLNIEVHDTLIVAVSDTLSENDDWVALLL